MIESFLKAFERKYNEQRSDNKISIAKQDSLILPDVVGNIRVRERVAKQTRDLLEKGSLQECESKNFYKLLLKLYETDSVIDFDTACHKALEMVVRNRNISKASKWSDAISNFNIFSACCGK